MTARSKILRAGVITAALATLPPNPARAGPPFQTDDPEPVPYQHFEFYTLSTGTAVRGDTQGEGPAWEFNYGVIPNGQVHIYAGYQITGP